MKYYKDNNNTVYAYSDGQLTHPVVAEKLPTLTAITEAEAEAIKNPTPSAEVQLAQAKEDKEKEIVSDFELAESQSVEYAGFTFAGGYDSVMSIDSYVRLTKLAGGTSFSIWDAIGTEHVFTEDEVNDLILIIGLQSSENKFTKKNRRVALVAISLEATDADGNLLYPTLTEALIAVRAV